MRIFIFTGEPSGDLHGAHLARILQALDPQVHIDGVGGTRMRDAGVRLVANSERWGAIGILDSIRKIPPLIYQFYRFNHLLRVDPPDALVLIDFGAFHVRLLGKLAGSGIRTVYYIPPGCWSRTRTAGRLPFLVDAIATPFPWSADNLRAAGAPARIEFVGHPILDYCRVTLSRAEARQRLQIDADRPVVAVVPGSRRGEVRRLLPVFLDAAALLSPAPCCLVTVAPSIGDAVVRRLLPPDVDVRLVSGIDYDLVQAADAAFVTSGTATLEMACLGVPMVTAYRGSYIDWLQYQALMRISPLKHIALPNILADERVVPELLQQDASPAMLADALRPLLASSPERQRQLDAFVRIRADLGDGQACARAAQLVYEVAGGGQRGKNE